MIVNVKSRVSMPKEETVYEQDSKMDEITVFCDRYYNGIDLSTFNAYLKIGYADGRKNVCNMSIKAENDLIEMSMPIDKNITQVSGELECQPMLKSEDGTMVLNASVFNLTVKPSIRAYEYFDMNTLASTTQELEKKLTDAVEKLTLDEYPQENSEQAVASGGVYSFVKKEVADVWTVDCETKTDLTLKNNFEFRLGEIEALNVSFPEVIETDFFCELIFIAGDGISVIFPSGVKWSGDSVINEVFAPGKGKQYFVLFYNTAQNGVDLHAMVKEEDYA